jgi:hypothetical protein
MADVNDLSTDVSIHGNTAGNPAVDTVNDGTYERLAVDANVSGGVIIAQKNPYFDYSAASVSLTNGVDYSVKSVTAKGTLDFVQIVCKNANYEVAIKIDGTERLRISQGDLGTIGLLSSNSTSIPIYAASASKIFSFLPQTPDDFATSFEIIVQATSSGNSIDGWFIHWNEE